MTKLYLVRHGETKWNVEKKMQGWGDSELTEKGVRQVKELKEKVKNISFSAIFSSTSGRTLKTTEILVGGVDIIEEPDLREINLGAWEGRHFDELKKTSPENFRLFWESPQEYFPEEGESVAEVQKRGMKVIRRIVKEYPEANVLIVSHSCILKSIILKYQDRPLNELWEPPHLPPASLTILDTLTGRITSDTFR